MSRAGNPPHLELVVLSAFGRTVTLGGVSLPPCHSSVKRWHSVIPHLFATPGPGYRFEPRWADATECIKAATRLGVANMATISSALAASNSPAEDMRRVRNFYAHRMKRTAQDAAATGLFSRPIRPDVFEWAVYTTGSVRVIESWAATLCLLPPPLHNDRDKDCSARRHCERGMRRVANLNRAARVGHRP